MMSVSWFEKPVGWLVGEQRCKKPYDECDLVSSNLVGERFCKKPSTGNCSCNKLYDECELVL